MTVLVDPAIWRWRGRRWAHLVSDASHDELHEFAARLGLRRAWFQGDHYDVPAAVRDAALELGAQPVSSRELVARLISSGLRRRGNKPPRGSGVLLVDAMNVIGTRPDGWWRDRDGAVRRLHGRLARLATDAGVRVHLVLDGHVPSGLDAAGGVEVHPPRRRGRDAGDDRLVEIAADYDGRCTVVTSDRTLAERVRALGADVEAASAFRTRLDALAPPAATDFTAAVGKALARVGPGEVITYGELAAEAGRPGAARAVGRALHALDDAPWWRVVPASGRLAHDPERAAALLRAEGVEVGADHRIGRLARRGRS